MMEQISSKKNKKSDKKNFFEVLADEDSEVYLEIKIPQPSPSSLPPPPKMEGSDEMKTPPQKMLETTRQMSEKDELRRQLFPEVLKRNQQQEMEILMLQQKEQNPRRLEAIIEQEEGTVSLQ